MSFNSGSDNSSLLTAQMIIFAAKDLLVPMLNRMENVGIAWPEIPPFGLNTFSGSRLEL